jgi:hypothetical protein
MWYAIVPIVAQDHQSEPGTLYGDGKVHTLPQLTFDLSELGAQALRHSAPFHLKASPSRLPADVREAQKVEAFRFAQPTLVPSLPCKAAKLNQAGFLWVQLKAKVGEPLP